ncbi:uncharacterized protein LOC120195723 [Hibiscus syriacus]|uniref:uncharacterized protein LOC120195723 n=1 Tax=Hibiscus syriacus TaxID=106335 RepID=UPI0019205472|nr:uncharacterized protein LOC120195723 [Hibiscus syriacus]
MAGENISSPVRLDISGSDGGSSRRSLTRSREKTLSRYLRASTGSCHDFCKYGKKHEPEENAKLPFRKRNMKKPSSESNLVRSLDLQQRMKITVTESKYFPNSQSRTPDTSGAVVFQLSPYSLDRKDSTTHGVLSDKEKTSAAKLKPKHSLNSSSPHDTSNVLKFEVSTTTSDRRTSRKHEIPSKEKKDINGKDWIFTQFEIPLIRCPESHAEGWMVIF